MIAGPFVVLICSSLTRLMATMQPDTAWGGKRKKRLVFASYLLTAIAVFGMVFLLFVSPGIGTVGICSLGFFLFLAMDAEVRLAGARNRARQVELLWILTIAVKSGRPLADEIENYAQGSSGRRYHQLMGMAERLREGVPLTELAVPQGLIPRAASMQVAAGVASSRLHSSLLDSAVRATRELSDDDEASISNGALVYPAAVVPITALILGFLMYYIIPKFKKIFDDFGTELPQPTILMIRVSDAIVNYWYIFALPLFYLPVIVFAVVTLTDYYGRRQVFQSFLGRWFIRWHSPDVLRSLSTSIQREMPIDAALLVISRFPGPSLLREKLAWAVEEIQSGHPTWQTLQAAGIIRHFETILLETAEQAGNLPWVMETIATNMERRFLFRLLAALEVLRPVILIGLSVIIGFIAFAMFLPLIKLLNDLS